MGEGLKLPMIGGKKKCAFVWGRSVTLSAHDLVNDHSVSCHILQYKVTDIDVLHRSRLTVECKTKREQMSGSE